MHIFFAFYKFMGIFRLNNRKSNSEGICPQIFSLKMTLTSVDLYSSGVLKRWKTKSMMQMCMPFMQLLNDWIYFLDRRHHRIIYISHGIMYDEFSSTYCPRCQMKSFFTAVTSTAKRYFRPCLIIIKVSRLILWLPASPTSFIPMPHITSSLKAFPRHPGSLFLLLALPLLFFMLCNQELAH